METPNNTDILQYERLNNTSEEGNKLYDMEEENITFDDFFDSFINTSDHTKENNNIDINNDINFLENVNKKLLPYIDEVVEDGNIYNATQFQVVANKFRNEIDELTSSITYEMTELNASEALEFATLLKNSMDSLIDITFTAANNKLDIECINALNMLKDSN